MAALLVLAAGCSGSPPPAAAPSADRTPAAAGAAPSLPPVPGIDAEAVRLRTDEAIGGQVQVRIRATGSEPFTVTSVALDSPGFDPVPARTVSTDFPPGRTIDLPVRYGQPRCDVAAEPAGARLTVVRPDGRTEDLRVPLAAEVMTRIHEEECAVLALLEVVDVEVVELVDGDDDLRGELRVSRRTGEPTVTVQRLDRSVLVNARAAELPARLDDDEQVLAVPVSFSPATCDPHVLAETKKPYVFPLEVVVEGEEPVVLDMPVDEGLRARLAAMVDRVCATR